MKKVESALRLLCAGLLVLALLCGACLGEGAASNRIAVLSASPVSGDSFVGEWIEPVGCHCDLFIEPAGSAYDIFIYWSSGIYEHSEWHMTATYDPSSGTLVSSDCYCLDVTTDESGEEFGLVRYTNGSASFNYSYDTIRWYDAQEDAGADIIFARQ